MRAFFFIYFSVFFSLSLFSADVSPLKKANMLFEEGLYSDAGTLYDSLIQKGLDSKEVLYKSAYIAERLGKQGMSIFYLRKIEKNYGSPEIENRIRQISEKIESEGLTIVENNPIIDRITRNKLWIWVGIILSLIATTYGMFKIRSSFYRVFAATICISAFLLQIGLVYFMYSPNQSLVIIQKTSFYEQPSFASSHQNDLIAPGSVLKILEQKDIWYKIQYEEKEHWLPFFVVREL